MKRQFKILITSCFATWLLLPSTGYSQQSPNLQQQISSKFTRIKNSVSEKLGRRLPSYRNTDYMADRSLRNPPVVQPQSRPNQTNPNRLVSNQQNTYQHPNSGVAYAAGYLAEPQRDFQTGDTDQGPQQSFEPRNRQDFQQPPEAWQTRNLAEQPGQRQYQNSLRQPQQMQTQQMQQPVQQLPSNNRTMAQAPSNYQNYLQSDATISPKPPSMDYYNQTRFRHFSNRISATERAIILEDELSKLRNEKVNLESKNQLLEDQVEKKNEEISRLQSAIDDAMQQLSKALTIQNQLQDEISNVEQLRKSEREASESLLDELRKQLNDLLANELIGAN